MSKRFTLTDTELDTIAEALALASDTLRDTARGHASRIARTAVFGRLMDEAIKLDNLRERIESR